MVLKKWNAHTTLKFILLYKQQECLWKVDSVTYRDRNARNSALNKMLEGMDLPGLTVDDIKKKIKYLRSTYMVEVNKIEQSILSDDRKGNIYKPSLPWFNVMNSFIKSIKVNSPNILMTADENSDSNDTQYKKASGNLSPENNDVKLFHVESASRKRRRRSINISESPNSTYKHYHMNTSSRPDQEQRESTNEFEIFSKYIGIQLKSLNKEDAIMAQQEIQSILTRYKLKNLRQRTETCYIVHSPSYQPKVKQKEHESPISNEESDNDETAQYLHESKYEED